MEAGRVSLFYSAVRSIIEYFIESSLDNVVIKNIDNIDTFCNALENIEGLDDLHKNKILNIFRNDFQKTPSKKDKLIILCDNSIISLEVYNALYKLWKYCSKIMHANKDFYSQDNNMQIYRFLQFLLPLPNFMQEVHYKEDHLSKLEKEAQNINKTSFKTS